MEAKEPLCVPEVCYIVMGSNGLTNGGWGGNDGVNVQGWGGYWKDTSLSARIVCWDSRRLTRIGGKGLWGCGGDWGSIASNLGVGASRWVGQVVVMGCGVRWWM